MPIYEYRCDKCGHKLEVIQKMSDDPITECPACGEAALRKLISAAGFQLKGSGWYVTDFRDKKSKGAETKNKGDQGAKKPDAGTKAGGSEAGKGESKPKAAKSGEG